jgi:hypothetical protein
MLVQLPAAAEHATATQAHFDMLRKGTSDMQRDLAAQLEPRLAAEIAKVSGELSARQGARIQLQIGQVVPVSVSRNESNLFVYTYLSKVDRTEAGATEHIPSVSTAAYCFARGKIFMLADYREFRSQADIKASRDAMTSWATATLAAN